MESSPMYYQKTKIINNLLQYLFILTLVIIPFSTIIDSTLWTILGRKVNVIETPMMIRLLDNLLMGILFIILVFKSRLDFSHIYNTSKLLSILSLVVLLSIVYSCFNNNYLVILVGIDSFLPIFMISLFLFLDKNENKIFHNKIVYFLVFFLYLNLAFQLPQSIQFANYYSDSFFGLSQRTIGFFREPNTLALFHVVSFYYIYIYMQDNMHRKIIISLLIPLGILLSGSMAALLAMVFILFYITIKIDTKYMILIFVVLGICFYFIAPYIPSRPGFENSILIRLGVILDSFSWDSLLISSNFGIATNMAYGLNLSNIIPESTLASNLINIGLFSTVIFYILFARILNTKQGVLFSICILTMSLSNIIYSAYPINLLFAFEVAYLIKETKKLGES